MAGTVAETTNTLPSRTPTVRETGELIAGRYSLERPLGQGGMGSLWVARHVELDVLVAIKFSALERSAAHDARFRREARATARLRSPHVVHVYDYGIDRDEPYIAMELLEGQTLKELLEREPRLPLGRVATLVQEVAEGLSLAHEAGIVHRDLKPSNLFLTRAGKSAEGVLKILDFGIAKASADVPNDVGSAAALPSTGDTTHVGAIVGSPGYMSPEQARGEPVDPRSDIWSLGVVVFRLLTGVEPFADDDVTDTLAKIRSRRVPLVNEAIPDLPVELDGFFRRALARPRNERFQSARDLSAALSAIAASRLGEAAPAPVTPAAELDAAKPPGRARETRSLELDVAPTSALSRRRRTIALIVVGIGASLGIGAGFSASRFESSAPTPVSAQASANVPSVDQPALDTAVDAPSPPAIASATPALVHSAAQIPPRSRPAASTTPTNTRPKAASTASASDLDPVFGLRR